MNPRHLSHTAAFALVVSTGDSALTDQGCTRFGLPRATERSRPERVHGPDRQPKPGPPHGRPRARDHDGRRHRHLLWRVADCPASRRSASSSMRPSNSKGGGNASEDTT